MKQTPSPARTADLRLGLSFVTGYSAPLSDQHPHVLLFNISRGRWQRSWAWLLRRMPEPLHSISKRLFPAHFLSSPMVLKTLKPGWGDEFKNEKQMYKKLGSLQGKVIPRFFGQGRIDGTKALVLSHVDGISSRQQHTQPSVLPPQEFQKRFEAACAQLSALGVFYDNATLDNVLLVGDKVVLLDLECAESMSGDYEEVYEINLGFLMDHYREYLKEISGTG